MERDGEVGDVGEEYCRVLVFTKYGCLSPFPSGLNVSSKKRS